MSTTSAQITMLTDVQIDHPKFQALSKHFQGMAELSFRKALLHEGDPAAYPLSGEKPSLEAGFARALQNVPREKKAAAINRALAEAKTSTTQVDLHSTTPVQEQMHALPLPGGLTPDELTQINRVVTRSPVTQPSAPTKFQQLEMQLVKLKCEEKTRELFEGADEMELDGVLRPQHGAPIQISPMSFGKFKEGEVRTLNPPTRFASIAFNDGGNNGFPQAMAVMLTCIEKDSNDAAKAVKGFFDGVGAVEGDIDKAVNKLVGLSSGASSTSSDMKSMVLVALVAAAVNALIGEIGNLLVGLFESETFKPQMVLVAIPSATSLFSGGSVNSQDETVTFTREHGKGKYTLTYHWRLK